MRSQFQREWHYVLDDTRQQKLAFVTKGTFINDTMTSRSILIHPFVAHFFSFRGYEGLETANIDDSSTQRQWRHLYTNHNRIRREKGSSINYVTVLGGGSHGFCDKSTKASVIKSVTMGGRGVKKCSKRHLWTTPKYIPQTSQGSDDIVSSFYPIKFCMYSSHQKTNV